MSVFAWAVLCAILICFAVITGVGLVIAGVEERAARNMVLLWVGAFLLIVLLRADRF